MNDMIHPSYHLLTDPGRAVNEDIGGTTPHAAWVLDGATGVGEGGFTSGATDARWYVQQFDHFLRQHVDDHTTDLQTIIRRGIESVATEFTDMIDPDEITPESRPSAVCVIARWTSESVETYVLGDCELVIITSTDDIRPVMDPRSTLARRQNETVNGMSQLMEERDISHAKARSLLRPKAAHDIRNLRLSDEHWTLCLSPEAATDGQYSQFDRETVDRILLCSDGFTRLITTFGVFNDWYQSVGWTDEHGIEQAFRRLRAIEQDDMDCTTYPRPKTHDDATVVSVDFSENVTEPLIE
ncbi:protein phosphatase 2C domain-containing protein [Halocatena pleomorpha]|nr:protein phosphatase 2C domain-containing protein [Halocatena pleomorpha]